MSDQERSRILQFWRSVEFFSPQSVPQTDPRDTQEPVHAIIVPDGLMPWESKHPLQRRRLDGNYVWRHIVYCGIYRLEGVCEILEDILGRDEESFDERVDGESCLFAFQVSHDGRVIFNTALLSTCAWAVGRTIDPGPHARAWLSGFDQEQELFVETLRSELPVEDDDADAERMRSQGLDLSRPIGLRDIMPHITRLVARLQLEPLVPAIEMRVKSTRILAQYQFRDDDSDFLNSFFLKDLDLVAAKITCGDYGAALGTYLTRFIPQS